MFLAIPYSFNVNVVIEQVNNSNVVTATRLNASFLPYNPQKLDVFPIKGVSVGILYHPGLTQ